MAQRNETKSSDGKNSAERLEPIPLAERRRMMSNEHRAKKPGQVITDWAAF